MNRALHRLGFKRFNKKKFNSPLKKWRIVRGDTVQIMGPASGRDIGKQGVVKAVLRDNNRVIVEGLNKRRRNVRSSDEIEGGVYSIEAPIHVSHVSLVCPETSEPTQISMKWLEDGTKVRVAKVSGSVIPYPKWERDTPRNDAGPSDTSPDTVLRKTFEGVSLEEGSLLFTDDDMRDPSAPYKLVNSKHG
jgi:large subunit ribosomal protein L24